jgi:VanZ family protein
MNQIKHFIHLCADIIRKHKFAFFWIPVFLAMAVIFVFSIMPPKQVEKTGIEGFGFSLNNLHFVAYFALSFLLGIALWHSNKGYLNRNHYILAILVCVAFGSLNELLQFFSPGRTPDFLDAMNNGIGAVIAQGFRFVLRLEKKCLRRIF